MKQSLGISGILLALCLQLPGVAQAQEDCTAKKDFVKWLNQQETEPENSEERATGLVVKSIREPKDLMHLCHFTNLTKLHIDSNVFGIPEFRLMEEALEKSGAMEKLVTLTIKSLRVNRLLPASKGPGLARFSRLEHLSISSPLSSVAEDSLPGSLKSLRLQSLAPARSPTPIDLTGLKGLERLEQLFLTGFHPKNLNPILELPALDKLGLNGANLDDRSIELIVRSNLRQQIRFFFVKNNKITDGSPLANFEQLESVNDLHLNPLKRCDPGTNPALIEACGLAALLSPQLPRDEILKKALSVHDFDTEYTIDRWVDYAFTNDKRDILKPLIEMRSNRVLMNRLGHAAATGRIEEVRYILATGLNPNETRYSQVDGAITTPLSFAIQNLDAATIQILIKHGADTTRKNVDGLTPEKELQEFEKNLKEILAGEGTRDLVLFSNSECEHDLIKENFWKIKCSFDIPKRISEIRDLLRKNTK